ncbi:MAG: nucleoside phosphorylase [Caldilineaceae bacterium]|nr:nucleoside phosphorylase [Caldilineaceae bacterium]
MQAPRLIEQYRYRENVPERGLFINGRPALTGIDPALVGEYVMLTVRDPLCAYEEDPAEQIAQQLEDAKPAGRTGMFSTWSGYYKGAHISVVSGGSGSPEAELLLHEFLENTDATTYLRVGGSGGISPRVMPGDVVITTGAVRDEGMTHAYAPATYPAVADFELVTALIQGAQQLNAPYHVGITRSSDSDFCGVGRPGVGGFMQPWNLDVIDIYARAGVLNGDRESAAAVFLPMLFGRRGGSVCSVADNIVTGQRFEAGAGHDWAIRIALEGLAILHAMDHSTGITP